MDVKIKPMQKTDSIARKIAIVSSKTRCHYCVYAPSDSPLTSERVLNDFKTRRSDFNPYYGFEGY